MPSTRPLLLLPPLVLSAAIVISAVGSASAQLSKEDSKCRDYISRQVAKLTDTVIREEAKCNQNRSLGAVHPSVDCSNPDDPAFPGLVKIAKIAGKLSDKVPTKCSAASAPASNGYSACPSPCDSAAPAIASYSDVAACLVCQAKAEASNAIRAVYGATPPIQGTRDTAWKCQNIRIGKGLRTYIKKRMNEQRKCQNKEDKGKIGETDCQAADLKGVIQKAIDKLQNTIAKCSDADLAVLTSCATTVAAETVCAQASGDGGADSLFSDIYPEPSTPDNGCTLEDNTTPTSTVNPNGCAVLARDTSACEASRVADGLTGYWLKFSCRVTLTQAADGVTALADGLPDYKSNYFDPSDACYESYTGGIQNPNEIAAQAYSVTFPTSPDMAAQPMMGAVVGLALNGVPIFANFAAPGDDIFQEAATFDRCGAHPQNTGHYHYHGEPYAISYDDSNFIGVMRDGYPVYGRKDPDGSLPTLDVYGGHTGTTVDSPATPVYHYHVNEQTSTNPDTMGQTQWFLTTGTFRGTPGACSGCN